jgi:ribose/xylose/arabinose/galactoside ABC-type transport system permease subunit
MSDRPATRFGQDGVNTLPERRSLTARLFQDQRMLLLAVRSVVIVALIAIALTTPGFLSGPSMLALVTTVSFIGCVAVGMTLITISGNIMSFCLGATAGATAMVFIVAVNAGGVWFGFAVALAFGAGLNGVQGFAIGWLRANPIIVSIAALALVYGIAEAYAEKGTIYVDDAGQYGLLKGKIGGVPVEFITLLAVAAFGQFILSFTAFGRRLIMIGSSFRAAEAVGLSASRTVGAAYAWAGLFAALTGIMLAIRYDSATIAYGAGYDYDAVAAVLVGGTAIKGGEGSILRTLIGALVIATIEVVLLLQGFRQEWQYLISGLIVLGVVMLQTRGTRD